MRRCRLLSWLSHDSRNTNPSAHRQAALYVIRFRYIVAGHLKNLIPVGTAMIIVADVKYARVSTSIPTVRMWCAHTTNPSNPIAYLLTPLSRVLLEKLTSKLCS